MQTGPSSAFMAGSPVAVCKAKEKQKEGERPVQILLLSCQLLLTIPAMKAQQQTLCIVTVQCNLSPDQYSPHHRVKKTGLQQALLGWGWNFLFSLSFHPPLMSAVCMTCCPRLSAHWLTGTSGPAFLSWQQCTPAERTLALSLLCLWRSAQAAAHCHTQSPWQLGHGGTPAHTLH